MDCNIGIARYYCNSGLSLDNIEELHKPFTNGRTIMDNTARVAGEYIGHFKIEELDAITGTILGLDTTYDRLRCECRRIIYYSSAKHCKRRIPECLCDEYHLKFRKNNYNRSVDKFDRSVCMGQSCIHYTGDNGCLYELSIGIWPRRYKDNFKCAVSEKMSSRFIQYLT